MRNGDKRIGQPILFLVAGLLILLITSLTIRSLSHPPSPSSRATSEEPLNPEVPGSNTLLPASKSMIEKYAKWYPEANLTKIEDASTLWNLDPQTLMALATQSLFRPEAEGSDGSIGLMQLSPIDAENDLREVFKAIADRGNKDLFLSLASGSEAEGDWKTLLTSKENSSYDAALTNLAKKYLDLKIPAQSIFIASYRLWKYQQEFSSYPGEEFSAFRNYNLIKAAVNSFLNKNNTLPDSWNTFSNSLSDLVGHNLNEDIYGVGINQIVTQSMVDDLRNYVNTINKWIEGNAPILGSRQIVNLISQNLFPKGQEFIPGVLVVFDPNLPQDSLKKMFAQYGPDITYYLKTPNLPDEMKNLIKGWKQVGDSEQKQLLSLASPETNKPLAPEVSMPRYTFNKVVNNPPQEVSITSLPQPPDLGTAYQLALWGDPKWQNIFFSSYKGANNQSSNMMHWDSNKNSPQPPKYSWGDAIKLSTNQTSNNQYITNVDPDTGEAKFEDVVWQNNIKLPNGEVINGVKIFNHQAKGIGILERLWFTTSPNFGHNLTGQLVAIHDAKVLAEVIGKIYFVIDGKVTSYDPAILFAGDGNDLTIGSRNINGGFIYTPLISYTTAQIYLTSNAIVGRPGRDPSIFDQLYYRVVGQDFDKKILQTVPTLVASPQARKEFLSKYQQMSDSTPKEEYTYQERVLVTDSWTKVIKDDGYSLLSFRVPSPDDLGNTSLSIKYPESGIPPVNISLYQLIGTNQVGSNKVNFSFSNRFISVYSDTSLINNPGGIRIEFNKSIPLPKGTVITVSTTTKARAEVFWQHRNSTIGSLRFGVTAERKERPSEESNKGDNAGKQQFNPVMRDFIVNQIMVYIDDPMIYKDQYNDLRRALKFSPSNWLRPWNEGNLYLQEPNNVLLPLMDGLEQFGDAGYYDVLIKPGETLGNTSGIYYYGKGRYQSIFNPSIDVPLSAEQIEQTQMVKVDLIDKDEMYSLGFMNILLKLRKNSSIMIMPGMGPCEIAGVNLTLFGYYISSEN